MDTDKLLSRTAYSLLFLLLSGGAITAQQTTTAIPAASPSGALVISWGGLVAICIAVLVACFGVILVMAGKRKELASKIDGLGTSLSTFRDNDLRSAIGRIESSVQAVKGVADQTSATVGQVQQALNDFQANVIQSVNTIQQTLPDLARRDVVNAMFDQLKQEIANLKSANEVVLGLAWSRLTTGVPPFAPQITSLTPDKVGTAGGEIVVIQGQNLSPDCRVWFGPKVAQPEPDSSLNKINVKAPPSQAGVVNVSVQSPNGLISAPHNFTYGA